MTQAAVASANPQSATQARVRFDKGLFSSVMAGCLTDRKLVSGTIITPMT
jgi:hypothetical protein